MTSIQSRVREVFDLLATNAVVNFDSAELDTLILAEVSSRENAEESLTPREALLVSLEDVWENLYKAKRTEIPAPAMVAGAKVFMAAERCFPLFESMTEREKVSYIIKAYDTVGKYRVQDVNIFSKALFMILNSSKSEVFKTFRRRDGIWEFERKFPNFLSYKSGRYTTCLQPYDFWHEVAILAGAREYYSDPRGGNLI